MGRVSFILNHRYARLTGMLLLCASMVMAQTGPQQVMTQLGTTVPAWVDVAVKIFGGMLAVGGFVTGINGFIGQEEGFQKVMKIGVGLVGIGLGIFMITSPATVRSAIGIDTMFQ